MTDPSQTNDDTDPLTKLAIRHGTDKWGAHFYTPVYHALLSHLCNQPVRLLEIGVGGYGFKVLGGASLAMWAEYFPDGQITGIDVEEKRLALNPRVTLLQGSQDDPAFLKRVCDERGPFDIVIDDGSHVPKHVVASFNVLFPALADGGIYIIEDVQTAFWPSFGGSAVHGGETIKLLRTLVDHLHHAEIAVVDPSRPLAGYAKQVRSVRLYHNLIVVEKGDNREPSSMAYRLHNPHAVAAIRRIERELANSPSPEGFANLIDLYSCGDNHSKAKQLTADATAKWPDNPAVLFAALNAAARRRDSVARREYVSRLLEIEPDNALLLADLKKAPQVKDK
jgi:Methyltransferase domain